MKRADRQTYEVEYCAECDEPLDECDCTFEDDPPPKCFPHFWLPSTFDPRYVICGKCGAADKARMEASA
jgi:hypothetical protein